MKEKIVLKQIMLAGMIVTTLLSGMDKPVEHTCNDKCYELIRDRIDENILGVAKDAYFRPFIATLRGDVLRAGGVNPVTQLIAIERQIPQQCLNCAGLHQLWCNHLHFRSVVNNVITSFMLVQLKNASSKNIAQLLNPQAQSIDPELSAEMHKYIHWAAVLPYLKEASDCGWNVPFARFGSADEDIHYVQLQGQGINLVEKIEVLASASDCNYYLKGTKKGGQCLFWSLNDGKECDKIPFGCKRWGSCSRDSYIDFGGILIVLGKYGATKGTRAIMEKLHNPEIVVFHQPAFLSCLCQELFKKSRKDTQELLALQKFVNDQPSLSGEITFTKTNLQRMISKELLQSSAKEY